MLHQQRILTEIEEEVNSFLPGMMSSCNASRLSYKHCLAVENNRNFEVQRFVENLRLSPIRLEVESRMTVSDRVQLLGSVNCNNDSHDQSQAVAANKNVISEHEDENCEDLLNDDRTTPKFRQPFEMRQAGCNL